MRVLVTGATGYIGGRLVPRLCEAGHEVRCFARAAHRLRGRFHGSVEVAEGDIADRIAVMEALGGCEAAYYLVHSMSSTSSFAEKDRETARQFGEAGSKAGVKLIVYLGGLGDDRDALSTHLRSRHEVGTALRESGVPVVELRAAQIIGSGSISFEMIRYLTDRLPVMIAPRWVMTRCQPIAIRDVLSYLIDSLSLPRESRIYEIGGTDVLAYRDMMLRYAAIRGLKRQVIVVPLFTPQLSSYWVHLITPIPAKLAQPLIAGLYNEVVLRDASAKTAFPHIHPIGFDEAVRRALDRSRTTERETTWFDAFEPRKQSDLSALEEGMLIDRRVRQTAASPERVAAVFSSLGGRRGWLAGNGLWRLRGAIDRLGGGVGFRRGRRSMSELRIGDAVDFWRVEAFEPNRLLRLRAEMRLPGRAWLQFEAMARKPSGCRFAQTAFFEPRGLWGYAYWYGLKALHSWIFATLATRIVRTAEVVNGKADGSLRPVV